MRAISLPFSGQPQRWLGRHAFDRDAAETTNAARVFVLAGVACLLIYLALPSIELGSPLRIDVPIIAGGSALLFGLVVARLAIVIVDQRRMAAELQAASDAHATSETRYRALVEQASDGIFVMDTDGRFVEVNPAACAMVGYARDELLQLTIRDLVPSGLADGLEGKLEVLRSGGTVLAERELRRRDGTAIPVEISVRLLPAGHYYGIVRDITERRAAEAERDRFAFAVSHAVREAAAAYRSVFEDNPAPMWVYDPATLCFLAVNDAAIRVYGYSETEFLAMTIADIRPADDITRLIASASGTSRAHRISGPWHHRYKDGTVVEVEVASHDIEHDGRPARLVLITDVTARRALETQLRQAQKMEAVGRLAGGVAHDFNNLLAAIRGYTELSLLELDPADPLAMNLAEVLLAADRARALTRRLLTFARREPESKTVVDLVGVLRGLDPMLQQVVDERIRLVLDVPDDPVNAEVDAALVEQAVLNLVINARDAIVGTGTIALRLAVESVDDHDHAVASDLAPGRYAVLSVIDDGQGIEAGHVPVLFEPFFTTKPANQGTGLGLSIVYSVATGAGGTVRVESDVGVGTRFDMLLPLSSARSEAPGNGMPLSHVENGGSESIFFVEDEPAIRGFVARVLQHAGYDVGLAASAEEALERMEDAQPPSLVVTDVLLPLMSGPEMADRLRARHPDLPVLYVSGYEGHHLAHAGELPEGIQFLSKPFSSAELLAAVRQALDVTPIGA